MVTLVLAPPTFAAAWGLTGSVWLSAAATVAMLFGGLMFGPDLDIQSRQYTRWGPLRLLWWPYKVAFRHRSRWSHGIVFGTLIRVVYFAAVLTLVAWACVYARAVFLSGGAAPGWREVAEVWRFVEASAAALRRRAARARRRARRPLVGRRQPHPHRRGLVGLAQGLGNLLRR